MNDNRRALPDLTYAAWRASSYSGGQGECVEIADDIPGVIPVRDSKCRTGPFIAFGNDAWDAFLGLWSEPRAGDKEHQA